MRDWRKKGDQERKVGMDRPTKWWNSKKKKEKSRKGMAIGVDN